MEDNTCEICLDPLQDYDPHFRLCSRCVITIPGNELIKKTLVEIAQNAVDLQCEEILKELGEAHETIEYLNRNNTAQEYIIRYTMELKKSLEEKLMELSDHPSIHPWL